MSENTLETAYANGQIIDASHVNEITLALTGAFVGRDVSGVPTPLQSLGTAAIPWGTTYVQTLILDGAAIDPSVITSNPNRIVSGKTRALSSMPDYLRADGAALSFQVLGGTEDLILSIDNTSVSVTTDVTRSGITAAPSANNTATVNDTEIVNDLYAGEVTARVSQITIDAAGSEVSARVGQIVAFRTPTGEIFEGELKSSTVIENCYRGNYFNDSGDPIDRGVLSNNDVITLLNIGFVFVEDNGTTVDVTYRTPSYSFNSPSSPQVGDYWFDISNNIWKRYSGTTFEIVNRIYIGKIVADDVAVVATRPADFSKPFSEVNTLVVEASTSEIVRTISDKNSISVYGKETQVDLTKISWNITTDLEAGLSELADTVYYLYLSEDLDGIISTKKPHLRNDLKGYYHPHESYRCVGEAYNDSSNDFGDEQNYFMSYPYNADYEIPLPFTGKVENTGTASILNQTYPFMDSVSLVSVGVTEVVFATGLARELGRKLNRSNNIPAINVQTNRDTLFLADSHTIYENFLTEDSCRVAIGWGTSSGANGVNQNHTLTFDI